MGTSLLSSVTLPVGFSDRMKTYKALLLLVLFVGGAHGWLDGESLFFSSRCY